MKTSPKPGEVYFADLGLAAKPRWVLVVSDEDNDAPLAIATVLSITRQHNGSRYETTLPRVPWLPEQSYVNAQSLQPLGWHEFGWRFGRFEESVMRDVRQAISCWLTMKPSAK